MTVKQILNYKKCPPGLVKYGYTPAPVTAPAVDNRCLYLSGITLPV